MCALFLSVLTTIIAYNDELLLIWQYVRSEVCFVIAFARTSEAASYIVQNTHFNAGPVVATLHRLKGV